MRPELAAAIREHVAKFNLGAILADAGDGVETTSVRPKKGLFGKEELVYGAAIITKGWLVWAISGPRTNPHALSARLNQITVQDYGQSNLAALAPDSGVVVNGVNTENSNPGSVFIGLEANHAGNDFKARLIAAVQN
ncbi:MAG: hypothetical protein K8R99_09495 [Actinomycetia bacterium]|nr:hypothetical protein [Actinomycetes bacterium]